MRQEIVGDIEKGSPWLQWGISERAKGRFGRKSVEEGQIIVEIEPGYVRVLILGLAGFQMWPRNGAIKNLTVISNDGTGYDLKVTEFGGTYQGAGGTITIYSQSPYPMTFDNARGTFVAQVSVNDPRTTEASFNGGYMGNCYWTNGKNEVLNWRGTPNRHFPLDTNYAIPGVSDIDPSGFGTWIYEGGDQLVEAPGSAFVTGAFYRNGILHCISYYGGRERVHTRVDNKWLLKGDRSGGGLNAPSFISVDGTKYVSCDGIQGFVSDDEVTWGASLIKSSGSKLFSWEASGDNLSVNAIQKIWPEIDDIVTITTTGTSKTGGESGGSITAKEVPLTSIKNPATGIEVTLDTSSGNYRLLYGEDPPPGVNVFGAQALPNGDYCSIVWAAIPVNGCNGPNDYKISNSGLMVAGTYKPTECVGINFYMKATTDGGVSGQSANLAGNTNCSQSGTKQIVRLSTWVFGYTGNLGKSILWSASGGTITGPNNQSTVTINPDNCNPDVSLTVTGACGSAFGTFSNSNYTSGPFSVSGPDAATVGASYSLTNGVAPISWSYDSGTINSSGTITAITGCGPGVVTGTDVCGNTASKSVRNPNGQWTEVIGWADNHLCALTYTQDTSEYIIGLYKYYDLGKTCQIWVAPCAVDYCSDQGYDVCPDTLNTYWPYWLPNTQYPAHSPCPGAYVYFKVCYRGISQWTC